MILTNRHPDNQNTFRFATLEDLPGIVAIYNSTVAGRMVTADTEPVTVESRHAWFYQHEPAKRPLWVVENEDKQMLGWASFTSFHPRPAYSATIEISIYLHEDSRGKGLGKKTLEFCLQQAPQYGVKNLVGLIFSHNEPSLKLFRYFGFEEWGDLPDVAVLDGIERSVKIVGKRIA